MSRLSFYRTYLEAKWQDRPGRERHVLRAQKKRLKRLLSMAERNVPFQSRRVKKLSADEFLKIPPTTNAEMMASFADTLNRTDLARWGIDPADLAGIPEHYENDLPWIKGRILVSTTSGTTGKSSIVLNSSKSWMMQRAVAYSRSCRGKISLTGSNLFRPYRMGYALIDEPWSVSRQSISDATKGRSMFTKIRYFTIETSIDNLAREIVEFNPQFLRTYPNYLELLAKRRLAGSDIGFQPEVILSGGDHFSDDQKRLVTAAFPDARIVNQYGATECLPIANSCGCGNLHLNSDYVILEPVDQFDQSVAPGEFSHHVLITNLLNDFQPLIRYRLTDSVRLKTEPCECQSPLPVLEIKGRSYPFLHILDNDGNAATIEGTLIVNAMLKQVEIAKFNVGYHRQNEIEIAIILKPRAAAETGSNRALRMVAIRRAFDAVAVNNHCEHSVAFKIQFVADVEPNSKKYKKQTFDVSVPDPSDTPERFTEIRRKT